MEKLFFRFVITQRYFNQFISRFLRKYGTHAPIHAASNDYYCFNEDDPTIDNSDGNWYFTPFITVESEFRVWVWLFFLHEYQRKEKRPNKNLFVNETIKG